MSRRTRRSAGGDAPQESIYFKSRGLDDRSVLFTDVDVEMPDGNGSSVEPLDASSDWEDEDDEAFDFDEWKMAKWGTEALRGLDSDTRNISKKDLLDNSFDRLHSELQTIAAPLPAILEKSALSVSSWLAKNRKPIKFQDVLSMLPAVKIDEFWSQDEEDHLQQAWKTDPYREKLDSPQLQQKNDLLPLYKNFARVFRKFPTDIIGPRYQLEFEGRVTIETPDGQVQLPDPNWPWSFCDRLNRLAFHGVFNGDLSLFGFAIQYVVMCRVNYRGAIPWANSTTDLTLDILLGLMKNQDGSKSIIEIHKESREILLSMGKRPSYFSRLLQNIEVRAPPRTFVKASKALPLLVKTEDLLALKRAVNSLRRFGFPQFSSIHTVTPTIVHQRRSYDAPKDLHEVNQVREALILNDIRYLARISKGEKPAYENNTLDVSKIPGIVPAGAVEEDDLNPFEGSDIGGGDGPIGSPGSGASEEMADVSMLDIGDPEEPSSQEGAEQQPLHLVPPPNDPGYTRTDTSESLRVVLPSACPALRVRLRETQSFLPILRLAPLGLFARLIDNGYSPERMKSLLMANDVCWMSRHLFGKHMGTIPVVDSRVCQMYEGLDDLRRVYPDELTQNAMLQNQQIQDYFGGIVTGVDPQNAINTTRGLDVLLRLIRHLYSHMSSPYRRPHEVEEQNPLLRLAWSDFNEDSKDTSHQACFAALKSVVGDNLATQPLSFEDLIELPVMHRTLWSMYPFALYHNHFLCASLDADDWTANCDVTPADGRAQSGLIYWRAEDPDNLGDHITAHFGLAHYSNGDTTRRVIWSSNRPLAIRVRCERACDFDNIKRIEVENRMTVHVAMAGDPITADNEDRHWELPERGRIRKTDYHLVALVQLADDPDPDKIQLFALDHSPLPSTSHDKCRLGVEGKTYMLFYVRAPPHQPRLTQMGHSTSTQFLKLYRDVRHAIQMS